MSRAVHKSQQVNTIHQYAHGERVTSATWLKISVAINLIVMDAKINASASLQQLEEKNSLNRGTIDCPTLIQPCWKRSTCFSCYYYHLQGAPTTTGRFDGCVFPPVYLLVWNPDTLPILSRLLMRVPNLVSPFISSTFLPRSVRCRRYTFISLHNWEESLAVTTLQIRSEVLGWSEQYLLNT